MCEGKVWCFKDGMFGEVEAIKLLNWKLNLQNSQEETHLQWATLPSTLAQQTFPSSRGATDIEFAVRRENLLIKNTSAANLCISNSPNYTSASIKTQFITKRSTYFLECDWWTRRGAAKSVARQPLMNFSFASGKRKLFSVRETRALPLRLIDSWFIDLSSCLLRDVPRGLLAGMRN